MKFKIFSTWELWYRKIVFILVMSVSLLSIFWYFISVDSKKSDTAYIVSILYALFLFFIGGYDNYMKSKTDEKFYVRKEYYLNLLKLKSVFDNIDLSENSDEDIFSSVLRFKGFTGRTGKTKNVQPYILQQGFKLNDEELIIEDEFIESRQKIIEKLNNEILQYIDDYSISKKYPYPKVNKVYFSVEEWCIEYTNLTDKDLKNMEDYIYKLFSKLQNELDELEIIMKKVIKKYKSYKLKVEWNIKLIENIYGAKLKYEFLQEDRFINEIIPIRQLIEGIQKNMCSNEDLSDSISEVKDDIQSVHKRIVLLEDNLKEEIDAIKYKIIDDLSDE